MSAEFQAGQAETAEETEDPEEPLLPDRENVSPRVVGAA